MSIETVELSKYCIEGSDHKIRVRDVGAMIPFLRDLGLLTIFAFPPCRQVKLLLFLRTLFVSSSFFPSSHISHLKYPIFTTSDNGVRGQGLIRKNF